MSDQFEEKYIKLMDDFNDYKDETKAKIEDMTSDFKDQKTQLEKDFADKVEENLKLQNDFNALQEERDTLKEKVDKFEADFAKIEEEKLGALRTKVTELNEQVHGTLTEDQINSFEEASLEHYVNMFTNIAEHMTIKQNTDPKNNYSHQDPNQKDGDSIDRLTNMVQNL